jgi:hypothetical protein
MRWYHRDPTLEEILSDPIFVDLMRADNVDPYELEAMLKDVAAVSRSVRAADNRQFHLCGGERQHARACAPHPL